MISTKLQYSIPFRLFTACGLACLFVFLAVFGVASFSADIITSPPLLHLSLLGYLVITIATTLFAISIDHDQNISGSFYYLYPLTGFWTTLVAIVEIALAQVFIPVEMRFLITLICQGTLLFMLTFVMTGWLQLKDQWPLRMATINVAILVAFSLFGIVRQSWIDLDSWIDQFTQIRQIALAVLPIFIIVSCFFAKSLRLSNQFVESIKLRFFAAAARKEIIAAILLWASSIVFLALLAHVAAINGITIQEQRLVNVLDFSFLAILWICYKNLALINRRKKEGIVATKIVEGGGVRFLLRHQRTVPNWATTVGLKTALFMIDHDPNGIISDSLPATIVQIRNDEIQRSVRELIQPYYLHNRSFGTKIFGTIDPEISVRPCIDVLLLFSALHLEAVPLIERRIKQITSLLPIIDSDLSTRLQTTDVNDMMIRNQWLFFFNYDWSDQIVMQSKENVHYSFHVKDMPSSIRYQVFNYLKRFHGSGNFIIIGPNARDRLIQEAPLIAGAIEAVPIPINEKSDELLIFLIKFETLIPRLQKYYALDSVRMILKDFDPSPESLRFLEIVKIRLSAAKTPEEVLNGLASIANYPLRGFKEKDLALVVMVEGFLNIKAQLEKSMTNEKLRLKTIDQIKARFISAIEKIGYPSQLLHLAQLNKMAMRQVDRILAIAENPLHHRFHEAWLVLSSLDPNRYEKTELNQILNFIWWLPENSKINFITFVKAKVLETLVNLTTSQSFQDLNIHADIFKRLTFWFIKQKPDPNLCILLLDSLIYLKNHTGEMFILDETFKNDFEHYLENLFKALDEPAITTAIRSRWVELISYNELAA